MTMKESSLLLSDGPFGSNLKSEHYCETGVRVIRLQNICLGYFDDTDKAYISSSHYEKLKRYTCLPGEIVIGTLGEPNFRACVIPQHIELSINKADCVHYIPKAELLNNKFACAYINCERTLQMATSNIHGTTRARIAAGQVNELPIYLPPLPLQQQFVAIARQADKSEFDGCKSQFIEMFGDPRTNPKGWTVKKLSELASYSIGLTYKPEQVSESGTIVLRSGNIQNSKIDLTDVVRVDCPIKESIFVQKDDILMCSRNGSAALVGKVAQIKDIHEPMTYGAFMTVIRSEYSDFLYLYFQSNDFREQVSTGKSSTMNQITQNMLDKISLPLPDDVTRKKLSDILHQADKSESGNMFRLAS